jgi:hypothetical protein
LKEEKKAGVNGIFGFGGITQEPVVPGEPAVRQVKGRDIARFDIPMKIIRSREKQHVGIEIQHGSTFWQRHD